MSSSYGQVSVHTYCTLFWRFLEMEVGETSSLDKFDAMVGSSLRVIYRSGGVTIYEVIS
jgi:hypothetical protein